uniref:ARAD1B10406p n=1 Tax=Blastobotrys adeninivorans TaxID=409370 RepID=A0A060TBQ8_BLAAD
MDRNQYSKRITEMYGPSLHSPDTESSSEDGCSTLRTMLGNANTCPLFVSPSNKKPSDRIAPYLNVIFPNVPERARQNNILLTTKELHWLDYYIDKFDYYCDDYDVTILIDGGASIEEEIQRTATNLDLKYRSVRQAWDSYVIVRMSSTRNYAAGNLLMDAISSENFRYWQRLDGPWWAAEVESGSICTFFDRFPQLRPSRDTKVTKDMVCKIKKCDDGSTLSWSDRICEALGISPAPTFAVECSISYDCRMLFYECIVWIVGALIQVNTVIGVNSSPDTYSVDILNFDLTVNRMMKLASDLEGEQHAAKRAVLYQVACMKSSVQILQLKLLHYLCSQGVNTERITKQDVDSVNLLLQEDIERAIELCPILGIRPLELRRFPVISVDQFHPFLNDIKADITYYEKVLTELEDFKLQMCPQEAIAQCAHLLMSHTKPLTFGPISNHFTPDPGVKVKIPIRALAGIGNGHVEISSDGLRRYLHGLTPYKYIEEQTYTYSPIPLEWINDPEGLAKDRCIPVEQMDSANYNPRMTLSGKIKFRYLTSQALQYIAQTRYGASDFNDREWVIWTLLRSQAQEQTKRALSTNKEFRNKVQQQLGHPWRWTGFVTNRLPPSAPRNTPMRSTSRGTHARTFSTRRRGTVRPKSSSRRICGASWTTMYRLRRH